MAREWYEVTMTESVGAEIAVDYNPRPVRLMAAPVHVLTPEYYDRLAALEREHWWWKGVRRITQRVLRDPSGVRRVFDAGCGTGAMLEWAGRDLRARAVGLDYSADALKFCRARTGALLIQGDATALPSRDASFDLVFSLDVLQHLPRPGGDARAVAELARILAPGGWLLLRTNSACGYPPVSAPDYHRYTLNEVGALVEGAGLVCARATYINLAPALALTLVRKLKGTTPTTDPGLPPLPERQGLMARIGMTWLSLESAFIRRVPMALPFGHSIVVLAQKPRIDTDTHG
jgi:SAM-dependent methyltransferase